MAKSSFYSGSQQVSANSNAVEDSKNAAALSETAAAASAAASATSAASGAASATTATTKASESAASATASATSASASQASRVASEAAKVASEAAKVSLETARDAAAASSTSASSSQAAASTSEANAATSAAAALVSENAAAASAATAATEASDSATSAAASEVSNVASGVAKVAAETAETNAETAQAASEAARDASAASEANAATSETNAATSATAAASSASSASTSATSASNAQTAAESARDATLAAYDNFDDRYLGSKASDPTVDNDGNALVAGSLYFDTVSGAMRVYTGSAWVAAYVNGADYLALSGGTMTGDVAYGDNVKATFGASADLQVYHTGSTSYIYEQGTGDLRIRGNEVRIEDGDGSTIALFQNNAGAQLRYNGTSKLETTSTGITAYSEALLDPLGDAGGDRIGLDVVETGNNTTNMNVVRNFSYDTSNQNLVTFYNNADVGFYNVAGGTQRMLWDASDEALEFGDNVKATFGASADLQVYHDGSNSLIQDLGTGILQISSDGTEVKISGNGTNCARFFTNGESQLFTNGNLKLATKNTGINVTGTVVADGLTVQSDYIDLYAADAARNLRITPAVSGTNHIFSSTLTGSGYDFKNNSQLLMRIDGFTNDISFYEDTGTTAKFFWDASAERLGIGTSSPNSLLYLYGDPQATSGAVATIRDSSATSSNTSFASILFSSSPGTDYAIGKSNVNTASTLSFRNANTGTSYVDIDSSGNLEMTGGGSVGWANFTFKEESGYLYVYNGSTKIMRVDASGNAAFAGDVEANATL